MRFLLTLAFVVLPLHAAQAQDTTQTALLRYQLKESLQQQLDATKTELQKEMQTELKKINAEVEKMRDDLNFYRNIGLIAMTILSILGAGTVSGFIKRTSAKLDNIIDEAIYRVDPRFMPVKLPASGMEAESRHLNRLGFKNLSTYQWLDDTCLQNAVIFRATSDEDAQRLRQFILDHELAGKENVVFVVYTIGVRISGELFREFSNVTYANNHLTLVQALFVAARGMVR